MGRASQRAGHSGPGAGCWRCRRCLGALGAPVWRVGVEVPRVHCFLPEPAQPH